MSAFVVFGATSCEAQDWTLLDEDNERVFTHVCNGAGEVPRYDEDRMIWNTGTWATTPSLSVLRRR